MVICRLCRFSTTTAEMATQILSSSQLGLAVSTLKSMEAKMSSSAFLE